MAEMPDTLPESQADGPAFRDLVRVFARIGWISFGGPAGQIALMQHEIVDQRGWVDQQAFLRALNLCHLLPGPEAQQLATWIGWRLHGVRGGLATGLLFVAPGALVMLALSLVYVAASGLGWFVALFLGIKAAVLAVVAQALVRVARQALGTRFKFLLALLAALALTVFEAPFPFVIALAGGAGALVAKSRPQWLSLHQVVRRAVPQPPATRLAGQTVATVAIWLIVWWLPMGLVLLAFGPRHVLWNIGLFFARLAIVTFGGAYAVLAYMAQQAVAGFGWLDASEMADGLGLAETTPGPLIMVTQFVGFLAGWRNPGPLSALTSGVLGALLTTWVTFAPCFLWIFACAPWMERLERARRLQGALAAITAAVVGVIANLALWFALHVLFRDRSPSGWPLLSSLDTRALGLALLASVLLLRLRRSVPEVLAICILCGWLLARA
ncbi:chromate efflux transporter [Novosphingobium huizhouense]|uniref:chromate efflux transporter n=1 Tax=Novosphingobium huizhouense TaxID=2866625 RepID=UPI001CD8F6A1|nr:chromate efflux transporter [Novosphingobium huizhouense]